MNLPDDHNCDALGCSSIEHVILTRKSKAIDRISRLQRRADFLRERIVDAKLLDNIDLHLDKAEESALRWAIKELGRIYCV